MRWIGLEPSPLRHWSVAFVLPLVVLLPATSALGATLPAMERFVSSRARARCIGAIYAANTLGAVAGTLLSTFIVVPTVGLRQATWLLAAANLLCGIVALFVQSYTRSAVNFVQGAPGTAVSREQNLSQEPLNFLSKSRLATTVFLTGLLGIGYETVGIRVLSQVLENTVYTFAAVLAVYLLGTAIGAALYRAALLGDLGLFSRQPFQHLFGDRTGRLRFDQSLQ